MRKTLTILMTFFVVSWAAFTSVDILALSSNQRLDDEIFFSNSDNVVSVQNPKNPGNHGTGILLKTSKGQLVALTNRHVCEALGDTIFLNNAVISGAFDVLYMDKLSDLCLVKVTKELEVRDIPLSEFLARINKNIYSIGYPLRHEKNLLSGRLIGDETTTMRSAYVGQSCDTVENTIDGIACFKQERFVSTNIVNFPGGSGSPVFNADNELIGLMSASAPYSNFGYMVRLDDIKRVLELN